MIRKKDLQKLVPGTPEYVIAHGDRQTQRGKQLSAILFPKKGYGDGERNPRKAYPLAKKYQQEEEAWQEKGRRWAERRYAMMSSDPLMDAYNNPPWPGAQKVPHTCYQWH